MQWNVSLIFLVILKLAFITKSDSSKILLILSYIILYFVQSSYLLFTDEVNLCLALIKQNTMKTYEVMEV
jgi:hypothetical protein